MAGRSPAGGGGAARHGAAPAPVWRILASSQLLSVCTAAAAAAAKSSEQAYDRKCDEIIAHSQAAARLYNAGKQREAHAKLAEAEASFRAAKKMRPSEPQAFINIATTMLNSQRFDDAVAHWKEAARLLPKGRMRDWAQGRLRWSAYGKVSVKRDSVYAHGQGNLTLALLLVAKQLGIYPEFPTLHHDKATMHAMLSATGDNHTAEAIREFNLSQQGSLRSWRAGLRQTGASSCCETCGGVVYDWPGHLTAQASTPTALKAVDRVEDAADGQRYGEGGAFRDGGAYVARFEGVAVAGDDGFILDEANCLIFIPSAGYWAQGPRNLQMLETWKGPADPNEGGPYHAWHDHNRGKFPNAGKVAKPAQVDKVASIVQFAATSYFHFMTEVLGRLALLLQSKVLSDPSVRLLAPSSGTGAPKEGFIADALGILAGELLQAGRVTWLAAGGPPDVRLRANTLYFANWALPAELGADGSHCATPRAVLRLVIAGLSLAGAEGEVEKADEATLLYISRTGQAMRGSLVDEERFRRGVAGAAADARPPLTFRTFDGQGTLREQAAAFGGARAVVGVHGGALANLLFCRPGAQVFEVGFASPLAGHYRHLAAAMGLRATLLPLQADGRGMGANEVRLVDLEAALAAIRAALGADSPPGLPPPEGRSEEL